MSMSVLVEQVFSSIGHRFCGALYDTRSPSVVCRRLVRRFRGPGSTATLSSAAKPLHQSVYHNDSQTKVSVTGGILQRKILGATGLLVSEIGFGASPLGNEFRQTDPAEGVRAVHAAIDQGINFFDVSPYYGRTLAEKRLGVALGGKRYRVILATKCGRYDVASFDFSAARLRASIDESLTRLRTGYIDLWQAHDVEFVDARQIVDEAIPAMRQIQQQGKVRFIG